MPNILATIADNQVLFDELKSFLLSEFEEVEGVVDSDRSDVQLGQMYRARLVGKQRVEEAFKKIAKMKTVKETGVQAVARHR